MPARTTSNLANVIRENSHALTLHFDETSAVQPLEGTAGWTMEEVGEPVETFPSGL